jgi:hypothetical protein
LRRRNKAAKSEEVKKKGKRASRDKRRLVSALEAGAAETTVETHVVKKGPSIRILAFSFLAFIATVLLAWFAMRPWHGGAVAFARSVRCGGLGPAWRK